MARVEFNDAELARMLAPGGEINRAGNRWAGDVRDQAKVYAPVDTGKLRQSINVQAKPAPSPDKLTFAIGSDVHYAIYQESGTTGPIYPQYASVLKFKINGKTLFRHSVAGVDAVHYLERSLAIIKGTLN